MQRKFKRLQAKSGPAHHRRWQPGQNDPKSWEISGLEVPVVPDARADDENLDVAEDFREHHFRHLREAQAFTAQITEGLVGWDIENLCKRAVLNAVQRDSGNVEMEDFESAATQVEPWISPDMKEKYWEIYRDDCPHHYAF